MSKVYSFCKPIFTSCKAHKYCKLAILNDFLKVNNLEWKYCVCFCTDGAVLRSVGYERECKALFSTPNGPADLILREALALQQLNGGPNRMLEIVFKIVRFIKTRPLKARLFQSLLDELEAQHNNLLLYCNSRRFSKRKFLYRVHKLRNEMITFLNEEDHALPTSFEDGVFLIKLTHIRDIFAKLNQLKVYSGERMRIFCNSMTSL